MDTDSATPCARARSLYPATVLEAVAALQRRDVWVAALVLLNAGPLPYRALGNAAGLEYEDLDDAISDLEARGLARTDADAYALTPFGREMVETLVDLELRRMGEASFDPPA